MTSISSCHHGAKVTEGTTGWYASVVGGRCSAEPIHLAFLSTVNVDSLEPSLDVTGRAGPAAASFAESLARVCNFTLIMTTHAAMHSTAPRPDDELHQCVSRGCRSSLALPPNHSRHLTVPHMLVGWYRARSKAECNSRGGPGVMRGEIPKREGTG